MNLNQEASPGTPGAGYPDSNERDVVAKQSQDVADSEAAADPSTDLDAVTVLPGTGGPDDSGDVAEPDDYNPTGHHNGDAGDAVAAGDVDPKTLDEHGKPVENPSG